MVSHNYWRKLVFSNISTWPLNSGTLHDPSFHFLFHLVLHDTHKPYIPPPYPCNSLLRDLEGKHGQFRIQKNGATGVWGFWFRAMEEILHHTEHRKSGF